MKYRYTVCDNAEAQHVLNITKWCGANFDDRVVIEISGPALFKNPVVDFYFQTEGDMMAFKLMWEPSNE